MICKKKEMSKPGGKDTIRGLGLSKFVRFSSVDQY